MFRGSAVWSLSLCSLFLFGCGFIHVQTGPRKTAGSAQASPQATGPTADGTVSGPSANSQPPDEPWMLELPEVAVVEKKMKGESPEDTLAKRDAAFLILIEYISFRTGATGRQRVNPTGPTAAKREREYYTVATYYEPPRTLPDGRKHSAHIRNRPGVDEYLERGPSFHVQILQELLSSDAVEAYKKTAGYLEATAPERRLAELRDAGDRVKTDLEALQVDGQRTETRMEDYYQGRTSQGASEHLSDVQRSMWIVNEVAVRRDWAVGDGAKEYFSLLSEPERAAWTARLRAAVAQAHRLSEILNRPIGSGGGSAQSSASTHGATDPGDMGQARNACLSRCQRSCPSPYGSGDQWTATNAEYSRCRNEEASCRMGCP